LFENRKILVGVLPKGEEVLKGFPGFLRVAREFVGARQAS
jgi:hypothetical protein